jgi:hypothetical protein
LVVAGTATPSIASIAGFFDGISKIARRTLLGTSHFIPAKKGVKKTAVDGERSHSKTPLAVCIVSSVRAGTEIASVLALPSFWST